MSFKIAYRFIPLFSVAKIRILDTEPPVTTSHWRNHSNKKEKWILQFWRTVLYRTLLKTTAKWIPRKVRRWCLDGIENVTFANYLTRVFTPYSPFQNNYSEQDVAYFLQEQKKCNKEPNQSKKIHVNQKKDVIRTKWLKNWAVWANIETHSILRPRYYTHEPP